MLQAWLKKRAIHQYQTRLPQALKKRYGGNGPYTKAQVQRTLEQHRFNTRFVEYAFFLHCGTQALLDQGYVPEQLDLLSDTIAQLSPVVSPEIEHPAATFDAGIDSGFGGDGV